VTLKDENQPGPRRGKDPKGRKEAETSKEWTREGFRRKVNRKKQPSKEKRGPGKKKNTPFHKREGSAGSEGAQKKDRRDQRLRERGVTWDRHQRNRVEKAKINRGSVLSGWRGTTSQNRTRKKTLGKGEKYRALRECALNGVENDPRDIEMSSETGGKTLKIARPDCRRKRNSTQNSG